MSLLSSGISLLSIESKVVKSYVSRNINFVVFLSPHPNPLTGNLSAGRASNIIFSKVVVGPVNCS